MEERTFKVGDRVEAVVNYEVANSQPRRRWKGVQGTVLSIGADNGDHTYVEIGDLSIPYCRADVSFFASSLKLVKAVDEDEDLQSKWLAEGMRQAGAVSRPVGSKVYSSHQGSRAPGVIVESSEAFPPYNYGVTFGGEAVVLHHSHLTDRKFDTEMVRAIDLKLKDRFVIDGEAYTVTELATGINNNTVMVLKGRTRTGKEYPAERNVTTGQDLKFEKITNASA